MRDALRNERPASPQQAVDFNLCYSRKVESGLYNTASEVVREGLRLPKAHDEVRLKWREQIERGWPQAQAGEAADGPKAMAAIKHRLMNRAKKRA